MEARVKEELQILVEAKLAAMATARRIDGSIAILAGREGIHETDLQAYTFAMAEEAIQQDAWFKQSVRGQDAWFLPPYHQPAPEPEELTEPVSEQALENTNTAGS